MSKVDLIIPIKDLPLRFAYQLVNTIASQTFLPFTTIYLINDHCTNFLEILNVFSEKGVPVKVATNILDASPGTSRQLGIHISSSDYLMFLDADDEFYAEDSLEKLYNAAAFHDVAVSDIFISWKDRSGSILHDFSCFLLGAVDAHGIMYSRKFITQHDLKFCDLIIHEDFVWSSTINMMSDVDVVYVPEFIYKFNRGNNFSITNVKMSFLEVVLAEAVSVEKIFDAASKIPFNSLEHAQQIYSVLNCVLSEFFILDELTEQKVKSFGNPRSVLKDVMLLMTYYFWRIYNKYPNLTREVLQLVEYSNGILSKFIDKMISQICKGESVIFIFDKEYDVYDAEKQIELITLDSFVVKRRHIQSGV